MSRIVLRQLRALLNRVMPGWHPLRSPSTQHLLMRWVDWWRPEILLVRHDFRLQIPKGHRSPVMLFLYLNGVYEVEESQMILNSLSPGDLAFDIGANIGYMTCLMAGAVSGKPGGEVHAFEPEPANFEILSRNIELNRLEGVVSRRLALASHSGRTSIFLSGDNLADHTLVRLPGREEVPIETATFDDYYARYCRGRQVRFVKIDVQGYEFEVLKGMRNSLARELIDTLLIELWPARMRKAGVPSAVLLELLAELPYRATILSDTGQGRYRTFDEIRQASIAIEEDPHLAFNVLLEPQERPS